MKNFHLLPASHMPLPLHTSFPLPLQFEELSGWWYSFFRWPKYFQLLKGKWIKGKHKINNNCNCHLFYAEAQKSTIKTHQNKIWIWVNFLWMHSWNIGGFSLWTFTEAQDKQYEIGRVEFSFQKAATNSHEPWVKENTLVQRHMVKEAAHLMMARKQTQQESRKKVLIS